LEKLSLHVNNTGNLKKAVLVVVTLTVTICNAAMIGGESGAYLRYPVGASALALGGAQSAAPASLLSWWNPALLSTQKERHATFGGGIRSFGQTDGFAALEFRVPPRVGMGLFLLYRGDAFLNDLVDENEVPLGDASYTTFTGKIALSYYLHRRLTIGCNISIHYAKIPSPINERITYSSTTDIGSFDFALSYRWSDRLMLSALLKDVGTTMDWNFESAYNYNVPSEDIFLPSCIFGSCYTGSVGNRPFIWYSDMRCYIFDGKWKKLPRSEAVFSNGVEWQYWKTIYLRMGIGDILLNGDITADSKRYWKDFSFRLSGGISMDLQEVRKGLRLNYGCSTEKISIVPGQQVDITLSF
jgi:hypothetical protein